MPELGKHIVTVQRHQISKSTNPQKAWKANSWLGKPLSPLPSLESHLKRQKYLAATWKVHCLHTTGSHYTTSFHSNKKLHSLSEFSLSELNFIIRIQIPSTLINKYHVNGGAPCNPSAWRTRQRIQKGSWLLRQAESEFWVQMSNSASI